MYNTKVEVLKAFFGEPVKILLLPLLVQHECGDGCGGPPGSHTTKFCGTEETPETVPVSDCRHYHGTEIGITVLYVYIQLFLIAGW